VKMHRVGRRKSNADEKNDQALEPIGLEKKKRFADSGDVAAATGVV